MAITDYRKLDDNEIVKLVDDNVRTSTGYSSSDLAPVNARRSLIITTATAEAGT